MSFIPYGHQHITDDDREAVKEVLNSYYLTQGPNVEAFEKAVCTKIKSKFGVCCTNGTSALHLAMIAAGVGNGDKVIVPAITFVASANSARFLGAEILFADIDDKTTVTMSPESCRALLEKSLAEGKPVKAVVTVDMAGCPCDMEAFAKLKKEFNFVWIEDACHAIGGSWTASDGRVYNIGEFEEVDMTVFSFHPVKHITTGEGGMIVTHSEALARIMTLYRSQGTTKKEEDFLNPEEAFDINGLVNPWYYEMQVLGFNYRMTEMQAALGISQLKRLESGIARRKQIAEAYQESLKNSEFIAFPYIDKKSFGHAYHLAISLIDFEKLGKTRAAVMNELIQLGVGTQVHYIPVPMQPYYRKITNSTNLVNSLNYYKKTLSLPCYPSMADSDWEKVVLAVKKVLNRG